VHVFRHNNVADDEESYRRRVRSSEYSRTIRAEGSPSFGRRR
jgi:hypothetical protein